MFENEKSEHQDNIVITPEIATAIVYRRFDSERSTGQAPKTVGAAEKVDANARRVVMSILEQ